jgi:hypothetical protein
MVLSLFLLAFICVGQYTAPFVVCSFLILINKFYQNMTPLSLFWVIFKHGVLFLGSYFILFLFIFIFIFYCISRNTQITQYVLLQRPAVPK